MPYAPAMVDPYPAHSVHLLALQQDHPDVRAALPAYRALLCSDERQREGRFHFEADRERFVIGRAVTRLLLSRFLGGDPRAWRFRTNPHGRPELASPPPPPRPLVFNVSHTHGLVACAVTAAAEVGVDVEYTGRRITHDVAERFFAPHEVAQLRALPDADQARAFFDYWTLKEAYIKARGLGLALPLAQFAFTLDTSRPPAISFGPGIDDAPEAWQFFQAWPTERHRLALAVRRRPDEQLEIRIDQTVPRVPA